MTCFIHSTITDGHFNFKYFFCYVYFYTFISVLDGCFYDFSSYVIERITRVWCIHIVSVESSGANLHINTA